MKVNICQFNYYAGNTEANQKQAEGVLNASGEDCLNIFSELSLSGGPLYNKVLHKDLYKQTSMCGDNLCSTGKSFIIGTPAENNGQYYNSLVFVEKGQVRALATKRNLSRFDGNFAAGNGMEVLTYQGKKIAFGFYEDIYNFVQRKVDVDLLIVCTALLFDKDETDELQNEIKGYALRLKADIILVNRIGTEGNYLFNGRSFVVTKQGKTAVSLKEFEQTQYGFDTEDIDNVSQVNPLPCYEERIYHACVEGIRDYWHKSKIQKAVIGLSGGIDSALAVVLAAQALGKDNVTGVLMPSEFSSSHSVNDALKSAENLGIKHYTVPVQGIFQASKEALHELLSDNKTDTTEENLQARARCMIVMAFCNRLNAAMINTSNKSESAVGYGTLYGDDSGALGPIGDLYKQDVYKLSRWINRNEEIIPWNSIDKEPSAELHFNQKDSDTLPEYDVLDKILQQHIERNMSEQEIINAGYDEKTVKRVLHLYNINEWKRRQEAPALRLSKTCFATDYKINF